MATGELAELEDNLEAKDSVGEISRSSLFDARVVNSRQGEAES